MPPRPKVRSNASESSGTVFGWRCRTSMPKPEGFFSGGATLEARWARAARVPKRKEVPRSQAARAMAVGRPSVRPLCFFAAIPPPQGIIDRGGLSLATDEP